MFPPCMVTPSTYCNQTGPPSMSTLEPEADAPRLEEQPGKFRAMLTSAVLILFTIAVGLMCVLVLSCTLTQTRMASIAIDGVNISVWKLDDVRKQWSGLRTQLVEQTDALSR